MEGCCCCEEADGDGDGLGKAASDEEAERSRESLEGGDEAESTIPDAAAEVEAQRTSRAR